MANSILALAVGVLVAALGLPVDAVAQNAAPGGWVDPLWEKPPITAANRKPAPPRSLAGTWGPAGGPGVGTQGGGVQLKPNNGRPENQLPYTAAGLALYRSHKALEGSDAVLPADGNDPRNRCEPLGVPRYNHYNIRIIQIFQDEYKVLMAYQFDNRWRVIWTDGRELPKLVDGGVTVGGELREQRYFGYSVGKWLDDQTLEVQTVGLMPEDRVWLDSTGRPISDQARIIETFRRVDQDTMVWSERIDDPKFYSAPWEALRMPMRLHDPRTDIQEYTCSPAEQEAYNRLFGNTVSGK